MFDYLHAFVDEAAARADPVVGAYFSQGVNDEDGNPIVLEAWGGIANVEVWKPGDEFLIDGLWRVLISTKAADDAQASNPSCEFIWDDGNAVLVQSRLPPEELENLMMQPVYAGREYPFLTRTASEQ